LRRLRVRHLLPAAAPGAALLLLRPFAAPGPEGLYQADLAGLVAAVAVGAFAAPSLRAALQRIPLASALGGLAHAIAAQGVAGADAVALLFLATSAAAGGFAAVGRAAGARPFAAGLVSASVLWVAMAGLFWADPVSERLPRTARRRFRQAVLHVDPALALAYDGAGFARMRAPDVYRDVPIASAVHEAPAAHATGLLWLAGGTLLWGAAAAWGTPRPAKGRAGLAASGPAREAVR
jgi:hypothetical protein